MKLGDEDPEEDPEKKNEQEAVEMIRILYPENKKKREAKYSEATKTKIEYRSKKKIRLDPNECKENDEIVAKCIEPTTLISGSLESLKCSKPDSNTIISPKCIEPNTLISGSFESVKCLEQCHP